MLTALPATPWALRAGRSPCVACSLCLALMQNFALAISVVLTVLVAIPLFGQVGCVRARPCVGGGVMLQQEWQQRRRQRSLCWLRYRCLGWLRLRAAAAGGWSSAEAALLAHQ